MDQPVAKILDRINQPAFSSSPTKKVVSARSRKVVRAKSKPITLNIPTKTATVIKKEDNFNELWINVEKCINPILENGKTNGFETAFQDIQKICARQDTLNELNTKYVEIIESFSKKKTEEIIKFSNEFEILSQFQQIQTIIRLIASLFASFERAFLFPSSTVYSSIKEKFIHEISLHKEERLKIMEYVACNFKEQRELYFNDGSNSKSIEDITQCIDFFGFEDEILETLLKDSSSFFDSLSAPETNNKSVYIKWLQKQIEKEHFITKNLKLFTSTQLIENAKKHLYGMSFSAEVMPVIQYLFEKKDYTAFVELDSLCNYSESLLLFINEEIKKYAQMKAKEFLSLDDDECIQRLFDESRSLKVAYKETKLLAMQNAIKGFSTTMNTVSMKSEFLFAKFVDKTIRTTDFNDVDDYIDFFRELVRIDEFVQHNKQYLVNRIVELGSQTYEKEMRFITTLKEYVGPTNGITSTIKMLEDAKESSIMEYKPSIPGRVMLITYDAWPEYPVIDIKVPECIQEERRKFEEFYKPQNERKQIKWIDYLEDVEFTNGCGISGRCSIIQYCCLVELYNLETPNVNQEVIDTLKKCGLVDDNGNVTTKEGFYDVPKMSLRVPEKRNEEVEYEIRRIRKQKVLAALVRVVKSLDKAPKATVFAHLKEEIQDVTDNEMEEALADADEKTYVTVEDDEISY